jgi:16S rRNA (guanine(527)-N(7))-methyltransferase RsmG
MPAEPESAASGCPVSDALEALGVGASAVLGRALSQRELRRFEKYLTLLQKWQGVQRLVGSVKPQWIVENLFIDSLLFLRVLPADVTDIADLGSGAGFPGIPIKIVRPDLEVTLIESRQRRVSFLATVIRELGLEKVQVVGGRAESIPARLHGAVIMRCAGSTEAILSAATRLVSPGGVIICSGPPSERPVIAGEWVEVRGAAAGSTRRFIVVRA